MNTSRFISPSSSLSLHGLLRRTRRFQVFCLVAAVSAHWVLSRANMMQSAQSVAKPLTTQFVKRQPRLTKPLEMKKRPKPRRRHIRRQMVSVKAQVHHKQVPWVAAPSQMIESLARPKAQVGRAVTFSGSAYEPQAMAQAIESTREPANKIAMALEMLDIEAMDTGKYHAMVVQAPYG